MRVGTDGPCNFVPAFVDDGANESRALDISSLELVDYKVRILTGGTEAVTRVLVESHDQETGQRWVTVGVSTNIVDASFEALLDSINYKLYKDGAKASAAA